MTPRFRIETSPRFDRLFRKLAKRHHELPRYLPKILNSTNGSTTTQIWGISGDKPVPADYDGDGKADVAIFRPGDGNWWIRKSAQRKTCKNVAECDLGHMVFQGVKSTNNTPVTRQESVSIHMTLGDPSGLDISGHLGEVG